MRLDDCASYGFPDCVVTIHVRGGCGTSSPDCAEATTSAERSLTVSAQAGLVLRHRCAVAENASLGLLVNLPGLVGRSSLQQPDLKFGRHSSAMPHYGNPQIVRAPRIVFVTAHGPIPIPRSWR